MCGFCRAQCGFSPHWPQHWLWWAHLFVLGVSSLLRLKGPPRCGCRLTGLSFGSGGHTMFSRVVGHRLRCFPHSEVTASLASALALVGTRGAYPCVGWVRRRVLWQVATVGQVALGATAPPYIIWRFLVCVWPQDIPTNTGTSLGRNRSLGGGPESRV